MLQTIFVGHGNPMYAIEENEFTHAWRDLGETLPKPKAIVSISAHWESVGTFVTATDRPRTIHDFYGFPQELFAVEYHPKGSPELAFEIAEKVAGVALDYDRGLDHGTWSVLKHIYPKADISVIQLSLDRAKSVREHFELAKKLQFLRDENVLIMGSGNIVHNLRLVNFRNPAGDPWAESANEKLKDLILEGDFESLINYESLGNDVRLAVPTPEHFLPLLYVLALKREKEGVEFFNDVVELGSLSMTSLKIG